MKKMFLNKSSAIKNLRSFLATAVFFLINLSFTGCTNIPVESAKASSSAPLLSSPATTAISEEVTAQEDIEPSFVLGIVTDHSLSFKGQVEELSEEVLSPLPPFFKKHEGSEQVFVSVVSANSNTLVTRYNSIPLKLDTIQPTVHKNAWIESEQAKPEYTVRDVNRVIEERNKENWGEFVEQATRKTSGDLTKRSDVAFALNRSIIAISEIKNAERVLILASDFIDTNKNSFAPIPSNVRVLVVGANLNNLEDILQTSNFQRFESLESAIKSITRK
jgi:hypothetical protein